MHPLGKILIGATVIGGVYLVTRQDKQASVKGIGSG